MRRFWSVVWISATALIGLVLGVFMTYFTVIVPRSVELKRPRPPSTLTTSIDFDALVQAAHATESWTVTREPLQHPNAYAGAPHLGESIRARATIPVAEQDQALGLLVQQLQVKVSSGGYISSTSNDSSRDGQSLYWRQSMSFFANSRSGTAQVIALGQGDQLVVLILIEER